MNDRDFFPRFYDTEGKVMLYWQCYMQSAFNRLTDTRHFGLLYNLLRNPNIVKMRCTGLKDKNGKLIYEDDIVRWSLCRGDGDICENYQIIWRDNCAAFGCLKSNGDILDMFSQPELKAKVIGNVHENPDLLESEKR